MLTDAEQLLMLKRYVCTGTIFYVFFIWFFETSNNIRMSNVELIDSKIFDGLHALQWT